jgi:hypothetical protein
MAFSSALLHLRHRNKEDELLPSMCESTVEIKRSDTLSLVVILAVDREFNGLGFMKPVDRMRQPHGPSLQNP